MSSTNLYSLRQAFQDDHIMLSFNGPFSQSLIEELGKALKKYLEAENTSSSSAMDVFSVYIEMTQNIRNYTAAKNYSEPDSSGIVIIGDSGNGRYFISAGNIVDEQDGIRLAERVQSLAHLNKSELKAAYKEQMRRPRDNTPGSGAGLGFIDMARKAYAPIVCDVRPAAPGRSFFCLHVTF